MPNSWPKKPQPAAFSEGCPPTYLCFVVGFLSPSAFHLSGFYYHSFCSSLLRFVLSCFVFLPYLRNLSCTGKPGRYEWNAWI